MIKINYKKEKKWRIRICHDLGLHTKNEREREFLTYLENLQLIIFNLSGEPSADYF